MVANGSKWKQMAATGSQWQQVAANDSKGQQMAANGSNCKWLQIAAKPFLASNTEPRFNPTGIQIMKPHFKELQRTMHLIRASQPKEIINLARWRVAQRTG